MKAEDVKEGLYIRWKAERMFKAWDTYGQIVKIEDGDVTIKTFDDFKETVVDLNGETINEEIFPVSKDDVITYIEKATLAIDTSVAEKELAHKQELRNLATKKYLLQSLVV